MKKLFSVFAMAALALSFGLTSCSDEDPAEAWNVDMTANSKITGYVTYQPDLSAATPTAYPKSADVKFVATAKYSDINGRLTTTDAFDLTTSYDESTGMYTINVPASAAGLNVAITFSGFSGSQKPAGGGNSEKGYYTPSTVATQNVKAGQTLVVATNVAYTFKAAPVQ